MARVTAVVEATAAAAANEWLTSNFARLNPPPPPSEAARLSNRKAAFVSRASRRARGWALTQELTAVAGPAAVAAVHAAARRVGEAARDEWKATHREAQEAARAQVRVASDEVAYAPVAGQHAEETGAGAAVARLQAARHAVRTLANKASSAGQRAAQAAELDGLEAALWRASESVGISMFSLCPAAAPGSASNAAAGAPRKNSTTLGHYAGIPPSLLAATFDRAAPLTHVLAVDADNYCRFLTLLPASLPSSVGVLIFYGSAAPLRLPRPLPRGLAAVARRRRLQLYPAGHRHDAADFLLTVTLTKLHGQLPKAVPFTIVSGDRGFEEVATALRDCRAVKLYDPHPPRSQADVLAFLQGL
ncbi:hypothetical protein MMPV_003763 [Pyropia vietnamensis]